MTDALPQYSIAQARDRLRQLVYTAEQGTPIEITRRGKRVAVILSTEEFDRLTSQRRTPTYADGQIAAIAIGNGNE